MILTSLRIEREPNYSSRPNQLIGKVKLDGDQGSIEIVLSATELNAILTCISKTVCARAVRSAATLPSTFAEAQAETLLIEGGGTV